MKKWLAPDFYYALAPLVSFLWTWGGAGFKPARRLLVGLSIASTAYVVRKINLGRFIMLILAMWFVTSLPYGQAIQDRNILYIFAIGGSYVLFGLMPLLTKFNLYIWSRGFVASSFGFLILVYLSAYKQIITWKVSEISISLIVGFTAVYMIRRYDGKE